MISSCHCQFWILFNFADHKDYFDLQVISAVDWDSWQQKVSWLVYLSGKGWVTLAEILHCLFGCGEAFFHLFHQFSLLFFLSLLFTHSFTLFFWLSFRIFLCFGDINPVFLTLFFNFFWMFDVNIYFWD